MREIVRESIQSCSSPELSAIASTSWSVRLALRFSTGRCSTVRISEARSATAGHQVRGGGGRLGGGRLHRVGGGRGRGGGGGGGGREGQGRQQRDCPWPHARYRKDQRRFSRKLTGMTTAIAIAWEVTSGLPADTSTSSTIRFRPSATRLTVR